MSSISVNKITHRLKNNYYTNNNNYYYYQVFEITPWS